MAEYLEKKAVDRLKSAATYAVSYARKGNYDEAERMPKEALEHLQAARNHKKAGT